MKCLNFRHKGVGPKFQILRTYKRKCACFFANEISISDDLWNVPIVSSLFIDHLKLNKLSLGVTYQNELMLLCQHMGSLMPRRGLSFYSNFEHIFSFPHHQGRFVVALRSP